MDITQDGISHLNIYSKGQTELGRFLSNFYPIQIKTVDGWFSSVEGYWYWMGIREHSDADGIRVLHGSKAKKFGQHYESMVSRFIDDEFEKKILRAIYYKLAKQNSLIVENKKLVELPFEHYYVFNGNTKNVKSKYLWLIDGIKRLCDNIIWLY